MSDDPPRSTLPGDEPPRSENLRTSLVPRQPPGSFSRIFLEGLDKYRRLTRQTNVVGSAAEEAAASLTRGPHAQAPAKGGATATARLRSPRAAIETLVVTLVVPAIGYAIDRKDPFFFSHRFSWIMFAPLLIGLRHGFVFGLTSAGLLDVAITVAWRSRIVPMERFPSEVFVGMLGLAMLVGQFSDVWKREIVRLDAGFVQMRRQLDQLSRAHFLLELSHDRLEHETAHETPNLRDALAAARAVAASVSHGLATLETIADTMLETFASYCMVEDAMLFRVKGAALDGDPVAVLGRVEPLDPRDPLVRAALRSRRLAYVPHTGLDADDRAALATSSLIAALPLVDTKGRTHAVLCIRAIPFFAFERKNLEALALLGGHFADLLATGGKATDLERGRRHEFEVRLARAVRDAEELGVPNMVATLVIRPGSPVGGIVDVLLGGALEELEFPFVFQDQMGNYYVFILLPMTDDEGARALKERIEGITRRELRTTLAAAGASFAMHRLQTGDHLVAVLRLLGDEGGPA